MACGFGLRSLQRMNISAPEFRPGWNETYNSTLPNDFFQPSLVLNASIPYVEFANHPVGAGLPSIRNSSTSSASSSSTGGSSTGSSDSPSASALDYRLEEERGQEITPLRVARAVQVRRAGEFMPE